MVLLDIGVRQPSKVTPHDNDSRLLQRAPCARGSVAAGGRPAGRQAYIYPARNLDSGEWVEINTIPLSGMDGHPCQNSMLNATEPKTWLDVCSRNSRER